MNVMDAPVTSVSNDSFVMVWHQVANIEILTLTNEYWLRFPPPSCAQHFIIAIVYSCIVIPGIIGNLLVILAFLAKSLRNHSNLLCANLAIADFLMNLEIPFLIRNSLTCGPKNFSFTGCQVYGFTGALSGTVAIASITAMAYQRYRKITSPFNWETHINLKNSLITVSSCWLYGLLFAIFPLVYQAAPYTPEGYLTSCSFDYLSSDTYNRIYIIVFGIAAYVLPLSLIIFFYVRIVQEVHKGHQNVIAMQCSPPAERPDLTTEVSSLNQGHTCNSLAMTSLAGEAEIVRPGSVASHVTTSSRQEQMIQSKAQLEWKLKKSVAMLIACWAIAWTPYALVSLAGVCSHSSIISPLMSMLPALMAKCASVVDPYIYFYSHPRYRRQVMMRLRNFTNWSRNRAERIEISLSRIATFNFQRDKTDSDPPSNWGNPLLRERIWIRNCHRSSSMMRGR